MNMSRSDLGIELYIKSLLRQVRMGYLTKGDVNNLIDLKQKQEDKDKRFIKEIVILRNMRNILIYLTDGKIIVCGSNILEKLEYHKDSKGKPIDTSKYVSGASCIPKVEVKDKLVYTLKQTAKFIEEYLKTVTSDKEGNKVVRNTLEIDTNNIIKGVERYFKMDLVSIAGTIPESTSFTLNDIRTILDNTNYPLGVRSITTTSLEKMNENRLVYKELAKQNIEVINITRFTNNDLENKKETESVIFYSKDTGYGFVLDNYVDIFRDETIRTLQNFKLDIDLINRTSIKPREILLDSIRYNYTTKNLELSNKTEFITKLGVKHNIRPYISMVDVYVDFRDNFIMNYPIPYLTDENRKSCENFSILDYQSGGKYGDENEAVLEEMKRVILMSY